MRLWFILCSCQLLLSAALPAAPLQLESLQVGSQTFHQVTILGANATDLYFTHSGGLGNVKLKYLSADLQQRFHYDPKAAAEAEHRQGEDDARYQGALASNLLARAQQSAHEAQNATHSSEDNWADPVSDKSLLGKPVPTLKIEHWLSDKPDTEGKCVLVLFWAPWSFPCRKCVPELNTLQKQFADKLVVIGLSSESQAAVAAMEEPKIDFASALDPQGKLTAAAGVTSIPDALLLDAKGIVRFHGHPDALTPKRLQSFLAKPAD